ncbi:hypothetical protein SAMN04487857_12055 [Pseudomonas sp. ok272]|uniref:hypothetical protein n=1 Tax=unclassified Pseudomonas TaxID=196821 RepID=UPI0008C0E343|nr:MULTISPECIES: hypothetical protein [unclassified Pseudomonas]SEN52955.1 hypothetical protein SAMN04487857_12055 [Pseudomonas sp. ok272]SFN33498.1 hypothetical protein SAMN04487858_12055 [Pseudomonas sp. ok602]
MFDFVEYDKSESLRDRMDDAGCVFEFVVLSLETDSLVGEATHRQALNGLYDQIMKRAFDWHYDLIKCPEYADSPEPSLDWELEKAVATPLSDAEVASLMLTDNYARGPLALYGHFREPPYGTEFKSGESEAQALFHEWCDVLGLITNDDIEVINWVKGFQYKFTSNEEAIPGREPWSDYFDSGLEWWGVWCLTIWNPNHRTLSALIASTTD